MVFLATSTATNAALAQSPTVAETGHWNGHAWSLRVSDDVNGRHCYQVSVDFPFTVAAPSHSPNWSSVSARPRMSSSSSSFGVSFTTFTVCPLAFVEGLTVANASEVTVTLASGATVRTSTIVPPLGLSRDVRYFVTQIPCGSRVTKFIGLSTAGSVVARFTPLLYTTS